jgi:probable rRNA maturation factor
MAVLVSDSARIKPQRISGLQRFLRGVQRAAGVRGEVSVLLTSEAEIKKLNRSFRGKNSATDVLSFPAASLRGPQRAPGLRVMGRVNGFAGDIAISLPTAQRQAREHGHSLAEEIKILMLHGMLHLAGMDHEHDGGEMRRRESALRRQLKLPQGLILRSEGKRKPSRSLIALGKGKSTRARNQ